MKLRAVPHLQKANAPDSDKIHVLSHELRTPLAVISGYAQVLREELTGQQATLLTPILENVHRLDQVISTLLEWETVQPTSETTASNCDLHQIVDRVVGRYLPMAAAKGLEIEVHSKKGKVAMYAAAEAIESGLAQIVHNSIKFSEKGTIRVGLDYSATGVIISVEDEGHGIPANREDLFEPFVQGSIGLNRTFDGLGLGLTLARTHMQRLGGTISLENGKKAGTKATFSFPRFASSSNTTSGRRIAA